MKEVFELSAAIISSVGGASVLIVGLSSWLGKVWANRILENEKKKHTKDIEKYKSELAKEVERLKVLNEKNIFISKLQFEKEFQIYLELWESLFDAYVSTTNLFPLLDSLPKDVSERRELYLDRYKLFCETYNTYSKTLVKYAPFYSKGMYNEFDAIRKLFHNQGVSFKVYYLEIPEENFGLDSSTSKELFREVPEQLKIMIDSLQNRIRDYLITLRNIENSA